MANPNQLLLDRIKSRQTKRAEFNTGILTADRYVKTLQDCVGSNLCYKYASTKANSFADVLTKASSTLTYNNPDMIVKDIYSDPAESLKDLGVEIPKNTLMVFKHVLTTPRKDRDGDILRTEGASVDPSMLLLWQHVHTLPIGKMLKIVDHNEKALVLISAVVDINELAHDAAVMIDNKMGRFSHGFRALNFADLKEEEGRTSGYSGFDVKEFEVMEESLVSVPSNVDAQVQEVLLDLVSGDKLQSSMMKAYANHIKENKTSVTSSGGLPEGLKSSEGKKTEDENGSDKTCGCGGKSTGTEGKDSSSPPEKANTTDIQDTYGTGDGEDAPKSETKCPTCGVDLVDGKCPECGYVPKKSVGTKGGQTQTKTFYGNLPGSWEDIQDSLRSLCRPYSLEKGLLPKENTQNEFYSYCYLMSTHDTKAVIAVESDGRPRKYYQVSWAKGIDGVAKFEGEPKEVEIRFSAEFIEKSKSLAGIVTKSGRALSKSNLEKLKEVEENLVEIHEHCSTRSGKALCSKTHETVKSLVTQAEAAKPQEGELQPTPGGVGLNALQASTTFLEKSTPEERARLFDVLKALVDIDKMDQNTKSIRLACKSV